MKFLSILTFVVIFSLLQISCGHKKEQENSEKTDVVALDPADPKVKEQLNTLLIAYFAVKDALVETDSKTAKYNAGELVATLAKVENNLMTDSQKKLWEENVAKLKTDAENIGKTDDVEMQRIHFEGVSNALFLIISSFKANTATVYQQFCPMAFNNKGGAWLSDKKEIRNPYFGDKMLKCGSVKQEF